MSDQQQQPPAPDPITGGAPPAVPPPAAVVLPPPKRQRRPSVRLGDIGGQLTYDNNRRTKTHHWKLGSKDPKSSKTRPLVNLTAEGFDISEDGKDVRNDIINNNNISGGSGENNNIDDNIDNNIKNSNNVKNNNNSNGVIGSWKVRDCSKAKRGFSGTKRVRTNWGDEFGQDDDESLNFDMDDDMELDYRGKETRVRVSDGMDGPSDTEGRNWNNDGLERDGVRVWLNQLGLGRYAPVFEVHEVDDEVLPLLTLEDLKDMGINAVGSRRKMFCSIQKLGKGFS